MHNGIILETKLVAKIKGTFYVPSYQRGYRWGENEVTRLLDDVFQNGQKNYCLQPVVVRKKDNTFELVDGQQRLTTIYLIYKYMSTIIPFIGPPSFNLIYETRTQSAEFLANMDLSKQDDNIDFWFIANAYRTIKMWFDVDKQNRVIKILDYFNNHVKIIWYEVGANEDAISLFTRLNIGKIPLTSAELVKAMFLSRDNSENMDREKQEEISLQWDNIEKELHNDSMWYFLTNNIKNKYQTRIDLILDLISGKEESNKEKYYTFFKFDAMRKDKPLEEIWRKIQQTFLILKDWFETHKLYHKIGYLIASGEKTLQQIFNESENKTKAEFNALLNGFIKKSIYIPDNYSELSYEKAWDREKIRTLLLLFNVESVMRNGESSQWFPFDKFKYNKGSRVTWSLEHIHAQQSEGMKTQEAWKEWLKLHIPSAKVVGQNQDELVAEMQAAVDKEKLERSEFDVLQQKVVAILSVSGNTEYLHSIANLALLNTADNAALNNSTFDVKRNVIIDMDKHGQYIPFCTKMVFLKYYTPSEQNQLHFWGQADRIAYVNEINTVLGEYLTEAINLEKEDAQ